MKIYTATASCDWGHIFTDERIEATTFGTAFARAGKLAAKRARRRPRRIHIGLVLIGTKPKREVGFTQFMPDDGTLAERPL